MSLFQIMAILLFSQTAYAETAFKRSCLDIHRPSVYTLGGCIVLYEGNSKTRTEAAQTCSDTHTNGHLALIHNQELIGQLHEALDLTMPAWCAPIRDDLNWTQKGKDGIDFQLRNPPWDQSIGGNPSSVGDGVVVTKDGMRNANLTQRYPFLCQFAESELGVTTEFKRIESDKTGSSDQLIREWSVVSVHVCSETCADIDACKSFAYSSLTKECRLFFLPAQKLNLTVESGSRIFDRTLPDTDCDGDCAPVNTHLLIVSGQYLDNIEAYFPDGQTSGGVVAGLDHERNVAAVAWYDGKILIAGGLIGTEGQKTAILYEPSSKTYTTVADLPTIRSRSGVATFHGAVIVCGGYENSNLDSCIKFVDYEWQSMPSMNVARHGLTLVNLDNKIYSMGGHTTTLTRTFESFDPTTDSWTQLGDLISVHFYAAAAVFEGSIILCGGSQNYQTCEKYDQSNDQWSAIASMNHGRFGFGLVVFNGVLYAAGGRSDPNTETLEVERYDGTDDAWNTMPHGLTIGRTYPTVIVI